MCSVQDDGDVNAVQKPADSFSLGRVCMKCKEEKAVVITRVNDAFCQACFQVYIVHKFRSTIGKSHLIRDGEEVLIGYSGGPASSALLHLVQEGLSLRAHKRLRFKPSLIHIDETGLLSLSESERNEKVKSVIDIMTKTGYPSFISPLHQALDLSKATDTIKACKDPCFDVTTDSGREGFEQIKCDSSLSDILASMTSLTAKEDYIRNFRNQLLAAVARYHGYGKVMVADTSSRLAVRILSDIAQGRGAQLPADTHFADNRHGDVMFVRPIREVTSKEVAMYNSLNQVELVFIPTLATKANSGASIGHLTETFVTGLQADFLSTVSNITRTAGKLDSVEKMNNDDVCVLCRSPLDTNVPEASALKSVEFSQQLTTKHKSRGDNCISGGDNCCGNGDEGCQTSTSSLGREDLNATLCYGCRLTCRDMKDLSTIPKQVTEEASHRITRSKTREEINEYLLDGGS